MGRMKSDPRPTNTALTRLWNSVQVPEKGLSVVEWIIRNVRLAGRPYGFEAFPEHVQICNDMHPRQIWKKPSQRGYSELGFNKALSLASMPHFDRYGRQVMKRADVIYSLPTDPVMKRISADRMDRAIEMSEGYDVLSPTSVYVKELSRGTVHCMHRGSATNTLSIPAEAVMVDEVDQGDMTIAANLDSRVQQASVFGTDDQPGLVIRWGNPMFFRGMSVSLFRASDQNYFLYKCEHCGHWQNVMYPDSIAHYYEKGQAKPKEKPYWMCVKCKKEITFSNFYWRRSEPNKVYGGEWVAKYPDRTAGGDGMRGYQAPMAGLTVGGRHVTAASFLLARDTGSYKDDYGLFLSHKCGMEYDDPDKTNTHESLRRFMMSEDAAWGVNERPKINVIGADQGAFIIGMGLVPGTKRGVDDFGVWDIWMIEQVPNLAAFDDIEGDGESVRVRDGRFTRLIREIGPVALCVDSVPNAASAESLFNRHRDRVWRTTYGSLSSHPGVMVKQKKELNQQIEHCRVNADSRQRTFHVDKVKTLDWLFNLVKARKIRLSSSFEASAKAGELIDHMTAVEKVVKIGDHGKLKIFYQAGGPDHFLMALMNACLAAMIAGNRKARYRGMSVRVNPSNTINSFKTGANEPVKVTP